jgi:tetratricopeptide (TPR) repeat protein
VLALALHSLVDFDLHSPGVRGCLAIIACLAAGPARRLAITPRRQLLATLAAAGLMIGLALGIQRALELGAGDALAARLEEVRRAQALGARAEADEALQALCAQLHQPPPPSSGPGGESVIISAALARLDEICWRWPHASELAAAALALREPGAQRLELGNRLRQLMPDDAGLRELQAQDLVATGRYPEAIAAARAAVALAPANLARRLALARLLDRAGDHDAAQGAALHAAAGVERAAVDALKAVVHPRNLP